jgi:hypothetical protein
MIVIGERQMADVRCAPLATKMVQCHKRSDAPRTDNETHHKFVTHTSFNPTAAGAYSTKPDNFFCRLIVSCAAALIWINYTIV